MNGERTYAPGEIRALPLTESVAGYPFQVCVLEPMRSHNPGPFATMPLGEIQAISLN